MIGGTRDWRETLGPASYNGVPFFVDKESVNGGRDIAVHTFVNSEEHSTEDMGKIPPELRIDGYICGDLADSDAQALLQQCNTAGAFTLVLPMFGPYQARCPKCHAQTLDREKQGWVGFELEFIDAGTAGTAFPATPLGVRLAASSMNQMPAAASGAISGYDPETNAASANAAATQHLYENSGNYQTGLSTGETVEGDPVIVPNAAVY